jgi:hypothetical protein
MEDRQNCSSGWAKFLNIKLSPEKLRACDGCSIPDQERKIYYANCRIRKCAMINEIANCAFCTGFPCDELTKAHSVQKINNREEFIKMRGKEISEKDYRFFIEPYTELHHLQKIRCSFRGHSLGEERLADPDERIEKKRMGTPYKIRRFFG